MTSLDVDDLVRLTATSRSQPGATARGARAKVEELDVLFVIGDYLGGATIGALTALGVRALVWPGMDMVLAMLLGMGVGIAVHLVVGLALSPLLGMFQTMPAAMTTGMYGGMLFGMRDSMSAGSDLLGAVLGVGACFGALVVLAFKVYDRALRGSVVDCGE